MSNLHARTQVFMNGQPHKAAAFFFLSLLIALSLSASATAEEKKAAPATNTKEVSPELKKASERVEECRKLFREGKQTEAVQLAITSIDLFIAPYPELNWVDIGELDAGKFRVVIHINTTEDERAKVKKFITRPYTFCVFPKEPDSKLLYVIDYEHAHDDNGAVETAALGRYSGGTHSNFGLVDPKADFTVVRDAALELIRKEMVKPRE